MSGVEVVPASEVVGMNDPPAAVRTRKDSSIVVSAELVRDGKADAMTSAGNTGAAMAAALLRMGRIKGAARPAIAVPIPVPGRAPQILVDGGATVDCTAEWLRQFAVMGREYARIHLGIDEPRVGLLSNGEEPGKGDDLRKAVYPMLASMPGFIGNVEGRDFMHDTVDVIVTDGFTGNVALKTVEGRDPRHRPPRVRHADVHPRAATGLRDRHAGAARTGRHAQPRFRGWLRAPGGRRHLRDRPRVVECPRHPQFRAPREECVEAKVVERMKGAIADAG